MLLSAFLPVACAIAILRMRPPRLVRPAVA